MSQKPPGAMLLALGLMSLPLAARDAAPTKVLSTRAEVARGEAAVLWRDPVDISSRNLLYGAGGVQHQPHGPFTFIEEDLNGTNPKYVVQDQDHVKWTVKLGMEARPETAASRLVWAVGYFTNEDYFLPELAIGKLPLHPKRGAELIQAGGSVHAARLKRHLENEKKLESWKWRDDPFVGSREFNGLKVMMALVNNWDLKDVNNEIYTEKGGTKKIFEVSDLGATFGATGLSFPFHRSKNDPAVYARSKFIKKISPEFVDFATPSRPALIYFFTTRTFLGRVRMDGLVHHIPRADARWIGEILARLSPDQIRDAFRAAGYTPQQIELFATVVQNRIAELNTL